MLDLLSKNIHHIRSYLTGIFEGFLCKYVSVSVFNILFFRYQEHGIIQKWFLDISRYHKERKTLFEDHPEREPHHQINLVNLSGAFFLLFTGLLLSVLSFLVEFMKYRRMQRKKCSDRARY